MNRCIVVQGPTNPNNVLNIKKYWEGFPLIFSTWKGANTSCYSTNDIVLFNDVPTNRGVRNLNLQRVSSLNGIVKAKEMGFSRVLKWREDMYPTNSDELISLFREDCINFYSYMNHGFGYVTDYFVEGPTDDLINFFTSMTITGPYPEHPFTEQIIKLKINNLNFIGEDLTETNDVIWTKRNKRLFKEMQDNLHTVILPEKLKNL